MPPGLYGRQREWERVLSALDLAQRGFGSVVLIEGRPGTGKTRLLQEAARAAWLRGFTMIERCRFGPDGAGAQTPAWLAEQLHTRIEEQAASGPVLIALDDVRASDAAWLPMSDLLPQQSRHPVMWMLTRNCAAGDPWFDQILGIPRAFTTRIELGPLPDSAVADIAADLLGARPAADLLALIACTGDDPLLTVELIEGLREEGRLAVRAGEVCLLGHGLPEARCAEVDQGEPGSEAVEELTASGQPDRRRPAAGPRRRRDTAPLPARSRPVLVADHR